MKIIRIAVLIFLLLTLFNALNPEPLKPASTQSTSRLKTLNLLIVADQGYREQTPLWQENIIHLIKITSPILSHQVGLRLKIIELKPWQRSARQTTSDYVIIDELLRCFPRTKKANFDIVIGMTSCSTEFYAYARTEEGYILISNKKAKNIFDKYGDLETSTHYPLLNAEKEMLYPSLILHELGHVFGCDDSADEKSIMYNGDKYPLIYSTQEIKTIKNNKNRGFPQIPAPTNVEH